MASISPEICSLTVLDQHGDAHAFSTLFTGDGVQRTLIVFIRHFFCGSCKEYVCALAELSPSATGLVIIACGQPNLIERYVKETNCPFAIYVDPTRKLYDGLGMIRTMSLGEKKPDYIKSSFVGNVLKSAVSQFSAGSSMFQGAEHLIDCEGKFLCSHRMSNTRDHMEIDHSVQKAKIGDVFITKAKRQRQSQLINEVLPKASNAHRLSKSFNLTHNRKRDQNVATQM